MALPEAFLARLRRIVSPEDYERVLASFAEPRAVGFRVNTLRAPDAGYVIDELTAAGMHPEVVEGLPLAYTVPPGERDRLLGTELCAGGRIYVQDVASQLTVHLLDPRPGERVLDLCAAPGSKTGQIAAAMAGEGEIAAVEVSRQRFYRMRANLQRQGASMVRSFLRDGSTVWRHRPDHFDRVLVDAPCSTEGRFRADEQETYRYWQPRKSREMARKQKRLLESAIRSTRPGGVVLYSTCTFAPEENEGVVSHVLSELADRAEMDTLQIPSVFELQDPLEVWEGRRFHPDIALSVRILPTRRSEAFFVARLRRR